MHLYCDQTQVFVDKMNNEEKQMVSDSHPINLEDTLLWRIIDRMANVININVALPPGMWSRGQWSYRNPI